MTFSDEALCVGVVVFKEDSVLLVQKTDHSRTVWQLPGGQVEDNETFSEAAVRELNETTTLRTEDKYLSILPQEWRATITRWYGERDFLFRGFACSKYEGEPAATDKTVYRWASISELETLDVLPNTLDVITSARQHFAMMN